MEQPTAGKSRKINPQYDGSRYGIKEHRWIGCSIYTENSIKVIDVSDIYRLIQVMGYFKHVASQVGKLIFMRGQDKLYESLCPAIYRDIGSFESKLVVESDLRDAVNKFKCARGDIGKIKEYKLEPILQHYGINTTWIDLVDNIWVALWFAANKYNKNLLRYERVSSGEFVYIIIVAVDDGFSDRGVIAGLETEVIDLRISAPSYFIRPHAQHGLLFRSSKRTDLLDCDYGEHVCGVIRLKSESVFSWLGNGRLVNQDFLFPKLEFDDGYKKLDYCNRQIINNLNPKIGSIIEYFY